MHRDLASMRCRTTISHFDFVKRDLCRPFGLVSELPAATFTIQFANELLLFSFQLN